MKIGLVLDDSLDTPDGVQQYVLTIGAWLSVQGHNVHYLVGATTRTDVKNIHSLSRNVKVRFNGNRLSIPLPSSHSKLHEFLIKQQFDVLHIQMPYSPFLAHRIIKCAPDRTAIVGTFHVLPNSRMVVLCNRALSVSLQSTLKDFDEIFTVSEAARSFAKKVYKIDSKVLPNVIQVSKFKHAKPLLKYHSGKPTILFLGRLVPRKGCKTLLQAVKLLHERGNTLAFKVLVGGKGPLLDELKTYTADNGLESIVEFAGFVPEQEKPDFLASADIAVFPSSGGESFGIVLLEAMAAGRAAVLAGDNPGYCSVLQSKPELLFPATDSQFLAHLIRHLLANVSERKNIVKWQSGFVKQFDVNVIGEKLVRAYESSCLKRRKRQ